MRPPYSDVLLNAPPGGLPEQKVRADRAVVMRPAVQRTSGGHLIANLSLACHKGDAGRVDLPGPDATVAFPDADIQVAADILAQVGKLKRPRRHPGLVQNATILLTVTCALLFAMPLIFGAYP